MPLILNYIKRLIKFNKLIFKLLYLLSIPDLTKPFKEIIKPGMIVIDIGANIGYYSLVASMLVGKNGKVIAFEPELKNYAKLCKNIKFSKYSNIIPINKALSDKDGKIKLFINKNDASDHRTYNPAGNRNAIEINAAMLDTFLSQKDYGCKVDFIKIDVQGFESFVLKGMNQIIKKNPNLKIITEFWPNGLREAGSSPKKFLEDLEKYGFKFFEIRKRKINKQSISLKKLLSKCKVKQKKDSMFYTDILCKR